MARPSDRFAIYAAGGGVSGFIGELMALPAAVTVGALADTEHVLGLVWGHVLIGIPVSIAEPYE